MPCNAVLQSCLFILLAGMVKPIFGKFSRTSRDTMITLNLTCIKLLVIHKYKTIIEFFCTVGKLEADSEIRGQICNSVIH